MLRKIKHAIKGLFEVYCKEFKLVMHDSGIILFFAFLPLAYPIIYSLIYNPEVVREVKMVVVDHDRSSLSRDLVRKMDATPQAHVIGYASDLNEARHAMNSHKAFAILEIPEGFGRKVGRMEQANAVLYSDMSLLLRYRGFLVATTNIMQAYSSELLVERVDQIMPLAATITTGDLMPIHNVAMGDVSGGFDSFIMPGVLILIIHQCIVLAVGMAGGAKHENHRLIGYDPINRNHSVFLTMVAQSLCYISLLIIPIIFLLHYVPIIFQFPMQGNTLEIFAFITPMILACLGLGFVFQGFVTERESVFVGWVVTSLLFLFLSGMIWPLYDMWPAWRWLCDLCPSTWGVEGYIKMNANGSSLAQVSGSYIHLWILAGVWWIAGWFVQRRLRKQLSSAA